MIGRWGYAAYHKPEDRSATETAARSQCNHPFVIGQGPTGGVMMYLADQSELQELRLKGGQAARTISARPARPAGPQDREIVSFDGRVMVMVFVDPEIAGRYGTGVYVRCAPSAGNVARNAEEKMTVTIWHNPKCATSRKVLEMIRKKGVEPRIVEYVKTPPSGAGDQGRA